MSDPEATVEHAPTLRWTLVVPVKDARLGKTRLARHLDDPGRMALVRAMAADTLAAAGATEQVDRLVVVTGDPEVARLAPATVGALVDVVAEEHPRGLDAAVRAGLARARALDPGNGVGVLLGDLPALRPDDLAAALDAAGAHARSFVPDADGTGTTLLLARPGATVDPCFGPGSARAHADRGHVRLDMPQGSTVRRDVDVRADLRAVRLLGPGPRTRAVLDGLGPAVQAG
ncbi:MAG TPA: 2-phospho-L-lactate guanylyltransferase [Cellulomonas sp.]|uniref:2-phospho-L-lactate guanylyltransferase n=1 Tax=Cellulomonas sp. TaxID=40001 RepID=UPI002E32E9A2|nr:2-phospho-L-lactate guanylyltransferase [Cellulomonas sp.]HEX5334162.1 2-phospho-L-lactate guanylyltransferase [Cellulomonas sp.]